MSTGKREKAGAVGPGVRGGGGLGAKGAGGGAGAGAGARPPGGRGGRGRRGHLYAHPFELKLKAVKLHVEEGLPVELIAQNLKVNASSVYGWVKRYRDDGEAALHRVYGGSRTPRLPPAVKTTITELKRRHPEHGIRRIAQLLRRVFLLPGSAETVRATLHQHALLKSPRRKPQKNPPKPRFFERNAPNQLWQSDIFTFRLNSQNAYLIGFIDDHSRYLTGLGVYRGQTAENVLEVYRQAVGEYGVPKEMLTDNGRQYVAWHGQTRFQMALARDRVQHIRSAPHHPMTLGKIERFWKTIWEEFLERARFDTFESAVERIGYWVKYYNHQRPHQGIEGLCPADRFFAIQKELRQVLEQGIAENVQALALHGQPKTPFYMVGRMGEKSVIIRAERGDVRMQVEGEAERLIGRTGEVNHDSHGEVAPGVEGLQCAGEVPGGTGGVGGATHGERTLSPTGDPSRPVQSVAGSGDGGYAGGVGADRAEGGGQPELVAAAAETAGEAGHAAGESRAAAGETADERDLTGTGRDVSEVRHAADENTGRMPGAPLGGGDRGGVERAALGHAGGPANAGEPQDLLSEANPGAGGHAGGTAGPGAGTPAAGSGSGAGGPAPTQSGVGGVAAPDGTALAHPGGVE